MKDNKQEARQQSQKDIDRVLSAATQLGGAICGYDEIGIDQFPKDVGIGERTFISITIGRRGYFSRNDARVAAKAWRKVCAQYPKAFFYPSVAGYDDVPREICEFEDAGRYVRQWARLAGMDDLETAIRYCGEVPGALPFLASCGVFGDELRNRSLAGVTPTQRH